MAHGGILGAIVEASIALAVVAVLVWAWRRERRRGDEPGVEEDGGEQRRPGASAPTPSPARPLPMPATAIPARISDVPERARTKRRDGDDHDRERAERVAEDREDACRPEIEHVLRLGDLRAGELASSGAAIATPIARPA